MMRSPPAPMRPSDNYPPQPPPSQSSYPMPPISQRYLPPSKSAARPSDLPPRPGSSTSAASANLPPHPTVPLVQPQPHRPSNLAEERTFLPLVHTQMQAPGSGRKEEVYPASTQVAGRNAGREREQDSGESNPLLPATQPDSQLFSLNQSTQQQERGVLVPDASHRPRRLPRVPADPPGRPSHDGIPDLLGESLPPSSQLYDLGDTRIPETQHGTHHTQQEGAAYQLSTTKRIDTYHPPGPSRSAAVGRPANPWSMDGYDGGTRRPNSAIPRSAVDTGGANVSGRSTARPRGAAELFLAASQQQQQGGTKTNSEKIMDALSEWSTAIIERLSTMSTDQKQVRDQVHELQLGQRALATKEEVTEEITGQLSPALHEFFQTLHSKLDESVTPLPEATARLSAEKLRAIMVEIKQMEGSQRSQEESEQKPVAKLIDHLISKLDGVSRISDFLQSYKELPDALRDVAVYKQSMDTLMTMAKNGSISAGPHPPVSQAGINADDTARAQLLQGIADLNQRLAQFSPRGTESERDGEQRVLDAITSLARGMDRLPLHAATQPPISAQTQTDILQLRAKVDSLSTDVRDIKAMLVQQHLVPQSTIDVANIVSQLKTAMLPEGQAMFSSTPAIAGSSAAVDFSQVQSTEIDASPAHNYPAPASRDRLGRSSATAVSVDHYTPNFTTPSLPPIPAFQPSPIAGLHFANGKLGPPPPSSDVFGLLQPTSDIRTHSGSGMMGQGSLGVMADIREEEEALDNFDDIFGNGKAKPADSGSSGKSKGKRTATGSGSGGPGKTNKKRARTSTTYQLSTSHVRSPPPQAQQRSTSQGAESLVPVDPRHPSESGGVSDPQDLFESQGYLLTGLKRSDRIAARRTVSNNPIYDSSSPPHSGSSGGRRKGGVSKKVKEEIIAETATTTFEPDPPLPDSLDSNPRSRHPHPQTSSPGHVENLIVPELLPVSDTLGFGNDSSGAHRGGSSNGEIYTQVASQGETIAMQTLTSYGQPDPAPMKSAQKYSRRRHFAQDVLADADSLSDGV